MESVLALQMIELIYNSRENESIAVHPVRILRVEGHELVEENVGNRCHTPVPVSVNSNFLCETGIGSHKYIFYSHGRARVARVGCEGGIDL